MKTGFLLTLLPLLLVLLVAQVSHAGEGAGETESLDFQRIDPATLNRHPFYSQVTVVQGAAKHVYVAGQTDRAVDYKFGDNACRHDDWRGQYIGVHENVEKALAAAGATWDDVVFIRRFVTDMQGFRSVMGDKDNPPPALWKTRRPPPSTLIQVVALSEPCQLLEVDVFAVVPAQPVAGLAAE